MTPEDFDMIALMLKQRSGLVLTKDKAYLLDARLLPIVRKWSLRSLDELVSVMRTQRDEKLIKDVVEAMTTNESFFFRDQTPFDIFKNILLPRFLQLRADRRQLRIWSAAASSGQEAYSLAMLIAEDYRLKDWKIDIVGTDLSSEMVERARSGTYSQFEVQRGLPVTFLVKYFTKVGEAWQIKEPIRNMVQFREANLLKDFGPIGVFDIVFCRNVLIYFDQPTKSNVLDSVAKIMTPDGVLFLGGAETILGITNKFRMMDGQRGAYMMNTPQAAAAHLPPSAATALVT